MSGAHYPRWDVPPVLIVSGCHGATQRYRCFHHDEQLKLRGIPSRVVMQWRAGLARTALGCGTLILHRVALDPGIVALIAQTRDSGGMVLFDIDDLVFEPESTRWHRGVEHLSPDDRRAYHDGVSRYRATLMECDGAIVPTAFLADRVEALGKPAWLSRNCLDLEIVELSDRAVAIRESDSPRRERVVVGYASGSRTHDWDFAEAAGPALRRVMERHPNVVLRTVGPIELGDEWAAFSDRVEQRPAASWRRLPRLIADFDVSLAPLELDNPFCKAKSELKWMEAAACGVPTIASATDAFRYGVQDGATGLLARDTSEWESALEKLVVDRELRSSIGEDARRFVRRERTTAGQAARYEKTLGDARAAVRPEVAPLRPRGDARAGLCVNFLLPEPVRGSGGHASIIRMAGGMAERGHEVRVHVDPGPLFGDATDAELARFMQRHFPAADVAYRLGRSFEGADALIATGWTTAAAAANTTNRRVGLYFVQDYEPYFQRLGPSYSAAESTYRLGLGHITLGPWLSQLLRTDFGAEAKPVDFGLEPDVYCYGDGPRKQQVVFYGRGTTPRRGTELGLAALRQVKETRPDVSVVLYGGEASGIDDDGFNRVGVLAPAELAELYRESVVGLALSYTNVSFVPFELMATGCAVVAVDVAPVKWCLEDGRNALLTESSPTALAEAMLLLLDDSSYRRELVEAARESVSGLSWEHTADQFEAYVREYVSSASTRPRPPRRVSTPVLASLQPLGDGAKPLAGVADHRWMIECGVDGLYRVDVRLTCPEPAPEGGLALTLSCAASGSRLATAWRDAADIIKDEWLAFEFQPIGDSASRSLCAELGWADNEATGPVELIVGPNAPAHRCFALDPVPEALPAMDMLWTQLSSRRRDQAQLRMASRRMGSSRLSWFVKRWRSWSRAMPPPVLRPWPEDLSPGAKLLYGLREYGLVAVLVESGRYARWRLGAGAGP